MKQQAFATNSISESIVAFAQFSRAHGLNVGIGETIAAFEGLDQLPLENELQLKFLLKPLFCNSPEDRMLFEGLYKLFWDSNPIDLNGKNQTKIAGAKKKKKSSSLVMLGLGNNEGAKEEAKEISGANEAESLRKTDFSKLSDIESKQLEEIAEKLFKEMALRLRRRMKESRHIGKLNLRRTIRRSINTGGEPINLFFKAQKPKRQRLILMLDVSGSMDKYSLFLLRFVFELRNYFRQLEAFIFSTSLIRISEAVAYGQMDATVEALGIQVNNWSSGTKIGECLKDFNEKYGKRILNGSPTFIILSDGLDTGEPEVLAKEMKTIQGKVRKLVWLNPLIAMSGYEPIQRGMKAALPSIDDFRTAHNLDSLLALEKILNDV